MPDTNVNIIDLDPVISTNDSDQFVVVQGTEGRRISLSGLADYTLEDRVIAKSNQAVTTDTIFPTVDTTTDTAFSTTPEDVSRFAFSDGISATTNDLDLTSADLVNGASTLGARNAANGNSSRITFDHFRDHMFSLEFSDATEPGILGNDDILFDRGGNTRVKGSLISVGNYVLNESTDGLPNMSSVVQTTRILGKLDGGDLEYATPTQLSSTLAYNFALLTDAIVPLSGSEYLGISQFGSGRRVDIDDLGSYIVNESTDGLNNMSSYNHNIPAQVMARLPGDDLEYITPQQIRDDVFASSNDMTDAVLPLQGSETVGLSQFGNARAATTDDLKGFILDRQGHTVYAANQTVLQNNSFSNLVTIAGENSVSSGTVSIEADLLVGNLSTLDLIITVGATTGIASSSVNITYLNGAGTLTQNQTRGLGGQSLSLPPGSFSTSDQMIKIRAHFKANSSFDTGETAWLRLVPTNSSLQLGEGSKIVYWANGIDI